MWRRRAKAEVRGARRAGAGGEPVFLPDDSDERRRLRVAIAVAAALHLGFLMMPAPRGEAVPVDDEPERKVFRVESHRFKPPEPPPPEEIPKPEARKVPIPDPTPDDPEPLREVAAIDPIAHEIPTGDWITDIPEPPPAAEPDPGPLVVGGDVARPRSLHTPRPRYTELARKARVQGLVILQVELDRTGSVVDVKVLRSLPMGLTQQAVSTVSDWRYEPATLNGKPVPVYMTVTIHYTLQ